MFQCAGAQVVTIPAVEVALDDEVPANWPQIDALKLSVNGAERNTLVRPSEPLLAPFEHATIRSSGDSFRQVPESCCRRDGFALCLG